jgi:hypothetical protein
VALNKTTSQLAEEERTMETSGCLIKVRSAMCSGERACEPTMTDAVPHMQVVRRGPLRCDVEDEVRGAPDRSGGSEVAKVEACG